MNMENVIENGIIRVSSCETLEIEADRARLHVRVNGETFVYGNAALQRSREVAELVARLKSAGLQDADITVASVQVRVNQGMLTKNTRASFGLVITVRDLGTLPDLLGAVSGVKHAELERLEWVFETDESLIELSGKAMTSAHRKAQVMAAAIGCVIAGLRSASDSHELPTPQPLDFAFQDNFERARMATPARVDLGTEFRATQTIAATVNAEFFVTKASPA